MLPLVLALAITHVTVVDVNSGRLQHDMTVVVSGERIAGMGSFQPPQDTEAIDGRGKYLIPGLWDMHVHLSGTTASALPVLVANGVTSVRDMGSRLGEIDDWRTRIAAGVMIGPRILRVGPILNGQKFNELQLVTGNPDETRGVVRALKQVGVDFIKIHRRLPRDSYFALIDEARKLSIPVVGHIPMTVSPEEASNAGQSTIEHTETLFEGTFSAGLKGPLARAIRRFREAGGPKLFATFAKNHTVVDPTLSPWFALIDDPGFDDPNLRYVAASSRRQIKPVAPADLKEMRDTFAEFKEVVRQMHRAGVPLVTGSDIAGARIPGFTLHRELSLLVECGLTPLEALRASTVVPAQLVGKASDLGSVEEGKLADLVLLDANPLDDIQNTQRISAVVIGGKFLRRAELDRLLESAVKLAAAN